MILSGLPISSIRLEKLEEPEPALEEQADWRLPRDLPDSVKAELKALVFGKTPEQEIKEILLDASTTIDPHAPLGGFYARGYDGGLVTIRQRHSLLEYRARGLAQEGRLPEALFASALSDFRRNELLAGVAKRAVETCELGLADLAVRSMYVDENYINPEHDVARAMVDEALASQQESSE